MSSNDLQIKLACSHFVSGHRAVDPATLLASISAEANEAQDFYGSGGAVSALEQRTAALLGKERALFFINGVTAQLAVLKQHAAIAGRGSVALHPLSHINADERGALEHAAQLQPIRVGNALPFEAGDLAAIKDPLAAVVVELPLRRAGYLLPPIGELKAIAAHCRERGTAFHIDGARLWESAAGYGVPLDELAALADSVYVSFYKGLGGLGGAVVAGSAEFIDGLQAWKVRFGGNMFTAYPYALAALAGIDAHLAAMPVYVERARELAAKLANHGIVNPTEPHVNAFQLLLPGTPAALLSHAREFAQRQGIWLFNGAREASIVGKSAVEIVIGDGCFAHSADDATGWIKAFLADLAKCTDPI